jgi:hypothetical protein
LANVPESINLEEAHLAGLNLLMGRNDFEILDPEDNRDLTYPYQDDPAPLAFLRSASNYQFVYYLEHRTNRGCPQLMIQLDHQLRSGVFE